MFDSTQYELIDFGKNELGVGEKLERFGDFLISRTSPPADRSRRSLSKEWTGCDAAFSKGNAKKEVWSFATKKTETALKATWSVEVDDLRFKLKLTPFGHVGLFVEQQTNWDWIRDRIAKSDRKIKVLNLFAYTGGSTLAAAIAGAEVTHVDSAKNVVNWARENAGLSNLSEHPIRWIVEDCSLFVEREVKRGNKYDAIILDPPTFGHGPKGEAWKIERDLIRLLRNCKRLLSDNPEFMLLTCHSPGYGPAELQATFCDAIFGTCSTQVTAMPLSISTKDSRKLNAGNLVRWPRF